MRIVFFADGHAGAEGALNPFPTNECQAQLLRGYEDSIAHFGEGPDWLICTGDQVDGLQTRGGAKGDNSWTASQIDQAANAVNMWKAKRVCVVSGTAYHSTGASGRTDFDELLASNLRASRRYESVDFCYALDVIINGWFRLSCRHHVGGSSSPPALTTAANRAKMWNILNAYDAKTTAPHLTVRGHVHRFDYGRNFMGAHLLLPCWLAESRFGTERCEGHIDIGTCQIEIKETESEGWTCKDRLYPLPAKVRKEWR